MLRSIVVCTGLIGLLSINLFAEDLKYRNMTEYLNAIVDNNPKAYGEFINKSQKFNELQKEKSIYEPVFVTGLSRISQNIQTTPEDSYYNALTNLNQDYTSKASNRKFALVGLAPSGAQWELGIENNKLKSNVLENVKGFDQQYGSYLKGTLIQPLLKNFGKDVTEIKAKGAEITSRISQIQYEKMITDLVGVSIQAYWQLYGAKEVYKKWENLVEITQKNLSTIRDLVKIGKVAQTEEMMIENTLYLRQSELLNAKDKVTEIENQILTLLNIQKIRNQNLIILFDEKNIKDKDYYELEDVYQQAISNWEEYLTAQEKLKYAILQKDYYKNQLLPELNLKASGDLQKLDSQFEESYSNFDDTKHNTWNVGMELKIPIFGNERATKDYENACLEVLKSKIEMDSLTKTLKNSLDIKVEKVNNTRKQVEYDEKGLTIKRELLKYENIKMLKGKSSVGDLLREEEKLIEYEIKMYEKLIDLKVSEAILDKTAGVLLKKYSVDVGQIQHKNNIQ